MTRTAPSTLRTFPILRALLATGLLCFAACQGEISATGDEIDLPVLPDDGVEDPENGELLPGESMVRRLNRREYFYIVSDVLGVDAPTSLTLPADGVNGRNFDTDGSELRMDERSFETYFFAAESVVELLSDDNAPMPACRSLEGAALQDCLAENVEPFLVSVFRQPVSAETVAQVRMLAETDTTYLAATRSVVLSALTSPYFLFHPKTEPEERVMRGADSYEIADRLASLLWSSSPDAELLELAATGALRDPEVRAAQLERMLADEKSERFMHSFADQWLGKRSFIEDAPAEQRPLFADMREETRRFVAMVFGDDLPLATLMSSTESILSERLAAHYEVDFPEGEGEWRRVTMPAHRRGVMTHAGVLTARSPSEITNPFIRGAWAAEAFTCFEPPAAPPDVEPIGDPREGETVRDRVEEHRSNPVCRGCHQHFDHFGLAFEEFDSLGRFREVYDSGLSVRPEGQLPTGETYEDTAGLADALAGRQEFDHCLSEMLATYALGRVVHGDAARAFVGSVDEAAAGERIRLSDVLNTLIMSDEFLGHTHGAGAGR